MDKNLKTPLQELIDIYKSKTKEDLNNMTAWQRSTYREVMKYENKNL